MRFLQPLRRLIRLCLIVAGLLTFSAQVNAARNDDVDVAGVSVLRVGVDDTDGPRRIAAAPEANDPGNSRGMNDSDDAGPRDRTGSDSADAPVAGLDSPPPTVLIRSTGDPTTPPPTILIRPRASDTSTPVDAPDAVAGTVAAPPGSTATTAPGPTTTTTEPPTAPPPTAAPPTAGPPTTQVRLTTTQPADPIDAIGARALAQLDYDTAAALPEWSIEFLGHTDGYLGGTWPERKAVEVYVRDGQSFEHVLHILGHEIGHAIDVTHLDDEDRAAWRAARGFDPQMAWWGQSGQSDFATPSGDLAEAIAHHLFRAPHYRSELATPPTGEATALIEDFLSRR